MNPEARTRLEELLKIEPSSLTAPDIEFLMARRSYLNEEQRHMLKQFETAKKDEAKEEAKESKEKAKSEETDYKSLSKAELQDTLRERKIDFEDTAKKEDLITLLEDSDLKK